MARQKKASQKPDDPMTSLPATQSIRRLAEEVMIAGNYGSLINTIRTSLADQLTRLKARQPNRAREHELAAHST